MDTRWWAMPPANAVLLLETDSVRGLSQAEAVARTARYGPNRLPDAKKLSLIGLIGRQFASVLVALLIAAAAVSWLAGEQLDASVIMAIILLNAAFGFAQEYRADRSLAALRRLSSPTARIIRDGALGEFPASAVVPGDIVLLESGDHVPADGRLLSDHGLLIQEASLTGESEPVEKSSSSLASPDALPGDRRGMAFLGTAVVAGKGKMAVTGTATATELGSIAGLLRDAPESRTPLELRLSDLGRRLAALSLAATALVFFMGIARGYPPLMMFLSAVSLAVAAIPEGLPAIVTMTLALGAQRLAHRNALVRRLACVESLGCASVICSDKTGTLTKNEMTVERLWVGGREISIHGAGYAPHGEFFEAGQRLHPKDHPDVDLTLRIGALSSGAELRLSGDVWEVVGDPTEGALLAAAAKAGRHKSELEKEHPLLGEAPFDSERKRMSVLRRTPGGSRLFVKGAPEAVLSRARFIRIAGQNLPLDEAWRERVKTEASALAERALRVLAVAYRDGAGERVHPNLEEELVFVGMAAMLDPPRPGVRDAVAACIGAGIFPVMITGDHKETAAAIARDLKILGPRGQVATGAELDLMGDEELIRRASEISVYARVSAGHKLRIVRAWKAAGKTVAMTGDGVNDAPAVREADIGVAMGRTGTDVTKAAAALVITDDDFSTIVSAVEEGRAIYDNIVKAVHYLVTWNLAEVMLVFFAMALGLATPNGEPLLALTAVQILWMNLVTDSLPALALAIDPAGKGVMTRPPRKPEASILGGPTLARLISAAALVATASFAALLYGLADGAAKAQTMALTTLVILEMAGIQIIRGPYGVRILDNAWLAAALAASIGLQAAVVHLPMLQRGFGTVSLGFLDWTFIAALALLASFFFRSNTPRMA